MLCNFRYIHQPLNYLTSFHQIVSNYMKDEKLGMKTFDHSIYKMVINCCAKWKCLKYNKSWHSTTIFLGGKYWEWKWSINMDEEEQWTNTQSNDNKGKDKVISMKCLDCRQETLEYDVSNFVPVIDSKGSPSM
jgi:hypothetical protein